VRFRAEDADLGPSPVRATGQRVLFCANDRRS
jgi:hypothetical protein